MRAPFVLSVLGVLLAFVVVGGACSYRQVQPGHSRVVLQFGEIVGSLEPGAHFVAPWSDTEPYDCRKKEESLGNVEFRAGDQLLNHVDVTVVFHVIPSAVEEAYAETGLADDLVRVHLLPKARSLIRELPKAYEHAEDLFQEEAQEEIQSLMLVELHDYCEPRGLAIDAVLMRNLQPHPTIEQAIVMKKERQQEAERQKAELERFTTEQQQKVAQAEAELDAAAKEAEQIRLLADAAAYQIEKQGEALRENPEILNLRAIEAWDGVLPRLLGQAEGMSFLVPTTE